ncbi:MAG: RNA polymerase sigma factor [Burkholderiales bacterium]
MSSLELVLPHLPRLRRYARLLTGDAVRADDLLQDTLERAARKWALWQPQADRLGPGSALRGWLLSLMHNLYLNQRRDDREALHEQLDDEQEPSHEPLMQLQQRLDLERALAQLSAPAREVLLLVCVEEFSYDEAARILDVPVGTVMSRLSRARERLRRLVAGEAVMKDPPLRVVR